MVSVIGFSLGWLALRERDESGQAGADPRPASGEVGGQVVIDVGAAALGRDRSGLTQHPEVVADGWLADGAALGEVAGADRSRGRRELSQDREAHWICDRLEELDVGIG